MTSPRFQTSIVTIAFFLLGITIFLFGSGWIRNYGGDAVVVMFLYSLLSVFWRTSPIRKAAIIFFFALCVEFLPLFISASSNPLHQLVIGSTVDPLDLLTYAIALAFIGCVDFAVSKTH